MNKKQRTLLEQAGLRDFDLDISRHSVDTRMVDMYSNILTMEFKLDDRIDQNYELVELMKSMSHRLKTSDAFVQVMAEYILRQVAHRLRRNCAIDEIEFIQMEPGFRIDTSLYSFMFQYDGISITATGEGPNEQNARIDSLLRIRVGEEQQIVICDSRAGKNLRNFDISKKVKAASDLLGFLNIPFRYLSYLVCIPRDIAEEVMRCFPSGYKSKRLIKNKEVVIGYMDEPGFNYVLTCSATTTEIKTAGSKLEAFVLERGNDFNEKRQIDWNHWSKKHSLRFSNSEKAEQIFLAGYQKIHEIHDHLVSLVETDPTLVDILSQKDLSFDYTSEYDRHRFHFARLYHERRTYEGLILSMLKHIYTFIGGLNPYLQLTYLERLFDVIPDTRPSSLEKSKLSLYGLHIFPQKFIMDLRRYLSRELYELKRINPDAYFTAGTFEKAVSLYIQTITGHTGGTGNDMYDRGSRLPGSFESGKRR